MSARARTLVGVSIMAALLALYFVFTGVRAVALLASGTPLAAIMGVALLVLPLIGAWALWRELAFGSRSTALVDRLAAEDRLPNDLGAAGPTGKPSREHADRAFSSYREAVEAEPESWRAWARLGIVYDACGDRSRARAAMRTAIRLSSAEISGGSAESR